MRSQPVITVLVALSVGLSACGSSGDLDSSAVVDSNQPTVVTTSSTTTTAAPPTSAEPADEVAPTTSTASTTAPMELRRPELDRVELRLTEVAQLEKPIGMAARPGSDALYLVEQPGRIQRLDADGSVDEILDLGAEVSGGGEQGLLGLTFDDSGSRLYINYTDRAGTTIVQRLTLDGDEVLVRETIVEVDQMRSNHNGGHLAFGPDGYLYIGLGDGGGGGDPGDHGQNPSTLLGSMLRIDVSGDGDGYVVPDTNPFVAGGGAPEVFAWGLRNPWRYSFDPATGDLWIADVGQDLFEEVSVARAADGGGNGANFGWNEVEGNEPFGGGSIPSDHAGPIIVYGQSNGRCSVTGGEVYRGEAIPELAGAYVFGDFCSGELFAVDAAAPDQVTVLDAFVSQVASFGVDSDGELYALSRDGGVFRIEAA